MKRQSLLPVYLSCLGYGVQAGAAMPLVPLALEHRGIDTVTIGLVEAVWGIGMIATAHCIPAVAARLGAVRLVCGSLVASAVLAVAFATTTSLPLALLPSGAGCAQTPDEVPAKARPEASKS